MSITLTANADNSTKYVCSSYSSTGFKLRDCRKVFDQEKQILVFKGVREDTGEEVVFEKFSGYEYGNTRYIVVDTIKHDVLSLKGQKYLSGISEE